MPRAEPARAGAIERSLPVPDRPRPDIGSDGAFGSVALWPAGPEPELGAPPLQLRDVLAYLFLAVTWGFSFLVLLEVTRAFGWVGAVTFRAFVASTTLLAVATVTGRKLDFGAGWRPLAIVGATTVAGQLIGLSFATPRIGTAMTAILVAAILLFSMIIGRLWGIERIAPRSLLGLTSASSGSFCSWAFRPCRSPAPSSWDA